MFIHLFFQKKNESNHRYVTSYLEKRPPFVDDFVTVTMPHAEVSEHLSFCFLLLFFFCQFKKKKKNDHS